MPQGCTISPLYTDGMLMTQGSFTSPLYERQRMPQGCMLSPLDKRVPQGTMVSPLDIGVPQGTMASPLYERQRMPQGRMLSPLDIGVPQGSMISALYERQTMPQGRAVGPLDIGVPQGTVTRPLYHNSKCVLGVPKETLMRPISSEERIFPSEISGSTISPLYTVEVPQRIIKSPRSNEGTGIPQQWSISSLLTEKKYASRKVDEPQGGMLGPLLVGRVPLGGVINSLPIKGLPQSTMITPISTEGRNEKDIVINPGLMFRSPPTEDRVVPQGRKISPVERSISSHYSYKREIPQGVYSISPYTMAIKTPGDTKKENVLKDKKVDHRFHVEKKGMSHEVGILDLHIADFEGREVPQGDTFSPLHTETELSKGFITSQPLYQTLGLPHGGTFSPIYTERRSVLREKIVSPHQNQRTEMMQGSPLTTKRKLELPEDMLSPKENVLRYAKTEVYQESLLSSRVVISSQQSQDCMTKVEKGKQQSQLLYNPKQHTHENVIGPHRDELSPPLITSNQNAQENSSDLFQEKILTPFLFIASLQSPTNGGNFKEKASTKMSLASAYSKGCTSLASSLSKLDIKSPILPKKAINNEVTPEQKETNVENQQENINDTSGK